MVRKTDKPQLAEAKLKKEAELLRQYYSRVLSTIEGKAVFRDIMQLCKWKHNDMVINPQSGEVNTQSTLYNVARKSVYCQIRQRLTPEYRDIIEADYQDGELENA